ncbi:uncharacterized protein LOC115548498 isoform X3 [Gadus morhua]|uniref:uncharacterized protein LOC115548498 isoform X3 n=1 Tax=Gadus morhua TaxID=8049 RepID=UPI0011B57DAA|nr:uncharacterized protein LOC115548498 isoform X3 [Gadus morhua]
MGKTFSLHRKVRLNDTLGLFLMAHAASFAMRQNAIRDLKRQKSVYILYHTRSIGCWDARNAAAILKWGTWSSHSVYSRNRMPGLCSAYSCSNERTVNNRNRGITFHKFPVHLQKGRAASTSRRADESLSVASNDSPEMTTSHPQPQPNDDHGYALPASPTAVKAKVNEHLARVESLAQEKKNAMSREKRAKTTVKGLLGDLRENNLINEELSEKLAFYSDLKTDFVAKQGHEYSQDCSCVPLELGQRGRAIFI